MSDVAKIAVLGAGGVGKSALTIRYMKDVYITKYDPTIEESYRKVTTLDDRHVVLDILDTAGTMEFKAMRDLQIKQCDGYLLVYSITSEDSFHALNETYRQILRVRDPDDESSVKIPMTLIGTKADLAKKRAISTDDGLKRALAYRNCPYLEVSAMKNSNIVEAFASVAKQVLEVKDAEEKENKSKKKHRSCAIL
jgi:small GTP-binding protein